MGPIDKFLLPDHALTAEVDGFKIGLRLHTFRSLPLSCVAHITLRVDGELIPEEQLQLGLNGRRYFLTDLASRYDDWWFVLDEAAVHIYQPGRMQPGDEHTVDAELGLLLPNLIVGPDAQPLLSTVRTTRALTCH